jgi:hypothetical protein
MVTFFFSNSTFLFCTRRNFHKHRALQYYFQQICASTLIKPSVEFKGKTVYFVDENIILLSLMYVSKDFLTVKHWQQVSQQTGSLSASCQIHFIGDVPSQF